MAASVDFQDTERFEIVRKLGEGGMGMVFEAHDRERASRVALKTVRGLASDDVVRLKNEFRSLQDLQHPNLVTLFDLYEEAGRWFFTMELVDGVNFLDHVRPRLDYVRPRADATISNADTAASPVLGQPGHVSPNAQTVEDIEAVGSSAVPAARDAATGTYDEVRLRAALRQLAQGLVALHAAGKVHRDLKPSNVFVTAEGRVVLLDLGLVTSTTSTDQSTEARGAGTPAYMAPEQAASLHVGAAADWYSVGIMLYESLTGRLPYQGTVYQMMFDKQRYEPPPPRTLVPSVPPDLDALCTELLRFDPAARPKEAEILGRLGVHDAKATPSVSSFNLTQPFVGRRAELEVLEQSFLDSRGGKSVAVLVEGESGVGKSALVKRFVDGLASRGAVVLASRCYERESVPFKAMDGVVDALGRYLARLSEAEAAVLLPREAGLLAQVFPVLRKVKAAAEAPFGRVADPQEQRSRLFRGMRDLFGSLGDRRPVVVVIDDMQWADADGVALLAELLRPPEAPTLLMIGTARSNVPMDVDLGRALPAGLRRIQLGRLPSEDACDLARQLLERGGRETTAAAIAAEAEGHPLFIDELVRHAATLGTTGALSLRLDEALRTRIADLPPEASLVLELLAVAGTPVPQGALAEAASLASNDLARCARLLRVGNLAQGTGSRSTDTLAPYHDRVREAVAAGLGAAERTAHHRRLALALEGSPHSEPEVLAVHWRGAGDSERAAKHIERAAAAAEEALAFDHAARLYSAALELRGEAHESARGLRIKLGHALANAGWGQRAAEAFLAAVPGAVQAEAQDLQRRAAEQYLRSGHVDEGLAAIREVLASIGLKLASTPRRAMLSVVVRRVRLRLRGLRFRTRDVTEVAPAELARIDICRGAGAGLGLVDPIRGASFATLGLLMALRAGESSRLALALADETAYTSLGGVRSRRRTEKLLALARSLNASCNTPLHRGWAAAASGQAAYYVGRFKDALGHARQAEEAWRTGCTGVTWELAAVASYEGWCLVYLGRMAEVAIRLPGLVAEAENRGDLFAVTNLRLSLFNLAWLLSDDPADARRVALSAAKRWSSAGFHVQHWWDLTAQTNIDIYEGDAAGAVARLAAAWPGLTGSVLLRVQIVRIEACCLRARATLALAQTDQASRPRLLKEAEKDAKRILRERMPWSNPLAEMILSGVAATRGDDDAAVAHATAATQGFEAADMALHAATARRRHGELVGGDEGRALVEAADAWMRSEKIKNPQRFTALYAPGFKD